MTIINQLTLDIAVLLCMAIAATAWALGQKRTLREIARGDRRYKTAVVSPRLSEEDSE